MSKVTEELDFLWRERLLEYYNALRQLNTEGALDEMATIEAILKLQGLHVKGIDQ
jgi:hypothetical protein